jgi:hypothetical protein
MSLKDILDVMRVDESAEATLRDEVLRDLLLLAK